MLFTPGTGGTVTATTLEAQFYTILRMIQDIERNFEKNPQEAAIASSTEDQDEATISGSATIPCVIEHLNAIPKILYPDPYVTAGWVEGTGSNGSASNFAHALAERALLLIEAERNTAHNPNGISPKFTNINWSYLESRQSLPIAHNALFNFSFTLPLTFVSAGNGAVSNGKEYLVGTTPTS